MKEGSRRGTGSESCSMIENANDCSKPVEGSDVGVAKLIAIVHPRTWQRWLHVEKSGKKMGWPG